MVSLGYTYLQNHEVVYIKYVQLFECQSYLNMTFLKSHSISNQTIRVVICISFLV